MTRTGAFKCPACGQSITHHPQDHDPECMTIHTPLIDEAVLRYEAEITKHLQDICGVSLYDLEDANTADMLIDGVSPRDAALRILDDNGWNDF